MEILVRGTAIWKFQSSKMGLISILCFVVCFWLIACFCFLFWFLFFCLFLFVYSFFFFCLFCFFLCFFFFKTTNLWFTISLSCTWEGMVISRWRTGQFVQGRSCRLNEICCLLCIIASIEYIRRQIEESFTSCIKGLIRKFT